MKRKVAVAACALLITLGQQGIHPLVASASFPQAARFLAQSVVPEQPRSRLRFLEDHQDAGDGSYSSPSTIQYETCYTDYKGSKVVKFHLCPTGSACDETCQSSNSKYATNINIFLMSFWGVGKDEANDNQNEEQADDQNGCVEGGDDDCGSATSGTFDPTLYINCAAYDEKFYVGPYCQDDQIYLGYYWDEDCTRLLDDNTFYGLYGVALEYSALSGYSLVNQTYACATCGDVDVDDVEENEEQQDGGECGALLSYSLPLWREKVDNHTSAENIGLVLALIALAALVALVATMLLMGSFYACYKFASQSRLKSEKEETLLPLEAASNAITSALIRTSTTFRDAAFRSLSDEETISAMPSQDGFSLVSKASSC